MLDYRPDLDLRTAGLLVDVADFIPTARGYKLTFEASAHTAHTYTLGTGEAYPNVLFATRWLSTPGGIVLVGSNTRLSVYDYTNGFINVSKAGDYSLGGAVFQYGEDSNATFDLCAFGDILIACNKAIATQKRSALDLTIATLFADLTDGVCPPPKANTCCVAANFVFLGDCDSWSTVTGSPDILAWSGLGSYNVWAVNPSVTQASFAQFNDTPGAITAVRPLNDGVVVFKAESMYFGRYVGAGTNSPIWDFVRVSNKIGCIGHRSVTNIDNALVFVGKDDVYMFDGTRPTSITQGLTDTIHALLNIFGGTTSMMVGHDKPNSSVWLGGAASNNVYVWNYRLNRWGKLFNSHRQIFCQTNADDFRTATLGAVTAGVQAFTTSTNHFNLYTLTMDQLAPKNRNTARSTSGTLTTGFFGDPNNLSTLSRVNALFHTAPSTSGTTLTVTTSRRPSGSSANSNAVTMDQTAYRFDLLSEAAMTNNFFQFFYTAKSGASCEIVDLAPTFTKAGSR